MKKRRSQRRTDQDSPWKDALTDFFPDFIVFCFPEINADIDWTRGYHFMDKELQRVARGHKTGRRLADKLVQVYLKDGAETWLFIHIEVQGRYEAGFERRMFVYNYRIGDRSEREVVSLAVLTSASGKVTALGKYEAQRWRCRTLFEFPVFKVADYAARWAELEASRNPFAVILLAQLKAAETQGDNVRRFEWKRRLIRLLYERGFSREQVSNLFKFIDWVLTLPDELEQPLLDEIYEYERGKQMPYITSAERFGHKRGMQEATDSLLLRQITRRCGELKDDIRARLLALSLEQKDQLAEALLDFTGLADLVNWLEAQTSQH